ncbi:alpha-amylase family glycosyl hydrolase [Thalassotalea sp. PS06]|uniref:alpha-amylase family glycosyl hydrolase n=1 Tax=Thalassotalea sp. PS06 TaxID=2594005 RepID=UPI00116277BC|nr:alpha-amylase family glycosyl hydrolase [Thalassotalea sp. PS06]QDP02080.1 alpha-amlyase [Thalassotalea sp. PS06]
MKAAPFNHVPLPPYSQIEHPSWSLNASIYEVNIRQYTPEGSFRAFARHLPRLKALGVTILWLMPIHPIGIQHRKGSLGSPYAISDHRAINNELGSEEDFRALINEIHRLGMYVIIDWVANHSAWDNPLARSHPHWYKKNPQGQFRSTTWFDWDDIIEFDFQQQGLRDYMLNAMQYYLDEFHIDGFRCDVAGFVPIEFWEQARASLDPDQQLFWLAEWEERDLHKRAFNMSYAWALNDLLEDIANGKRNAENLCGYIAKHNNAFPINAIRMNFLDNHDKNAWDGSVQQRFGIAEEALMALTMVMDGMPLIYSGQEVATEQSLAFFERDPIQWPEQIVTHPRHVWLQRMLTLKSNHPALQNGCAGSLMQEIPHDQRNHIIAFSRQSQHQNHNHCLVFIANLSEEKRIIELDHRAIQFAELECYTSSSSSKDTDFKKVELEAWGYRVLVSKNLEQ